MFGVNTVIFSPTIFAAVAAACVGLAAFWANPQRTTNRAFFTGSIHVSVWLLSLHLATSASIDEGLFWLQLACSIGALLPLHICIIQQVLATSLGNSLGGWLSRYWGWIVISAILATIPFTNVFIPNHSTPEHRLRGWGYYAYIVTDICLYALLVRDAIRSIRVVVGVKRLELKVWLSGGCVIAVTVLCLMILNGLTKNSSYIRLQPFFVLIFYAGTAYAITTHRILDARQVLLLGLERFLLVGAVAICAYAVDLGFEKIFPSPVDLFATTAVALWVAGTLNASLNRLFHFYPEATAARQAAFAATRREMGVENLEKAFTGILKGWGQTEYAAVISGSNGPLRGSGMEIPADGPIGKAIRQLRWATPERLIRERSTSERQALAAFLVEHELGAMVIGEGRALTVLVCVGIPASRRPFTFPQINQLTELASIIESALERAHFSVKAQHAEQLATVGLLGASLAHEIRNPLVTIKTFVQLLPQHHQDPAFRNKFFGLIGDEVTRIDRLTEQLLDLASPRAYKAHPVELHPVLRSSIDLVAAKASDKRIQFLTELNASPELVLTDVSAAKQVLLNLCFNAIQAVESQSTERWVKVSTRNVPGGVEMVVEDSGPGIAAEIRPRLFQPFQSTKSSGFGLGLAICRDILAGLDATISVDPSSSGRGATFRVVFPCPA